MKSTLISWMGLFFLCVVSCIFNPPNNNDNNNPNDTIIGWERAGINSTGENSQHVNVCHYGEHLFTFNYRGELFHCTYPELQWSQMSVPNGHRVRCFDCDTVNGFLYVSTIECGVYEYSIRSETWRGIVPKNDLWYDSTKLYEDSILNIHLYKVIIHQNLLYIMTVQVWGTANQSYNNISIWKSNRDTLWEHADSGWAGNTITNFYSIDNYLYASTFDAGLWRYDGVSWMVIPGTRQEDVYFLDTSGGDTRSIPGFMPRSMVKHNNEIYVGNLTGFVHKMLLGYAWDRTGLFFLDYNANKIMEFSTKTMSLYSYNGYLIKATYYYNDSADLWYNMTPRFHAFDTTYNNALPGDVFGMTNIGDTLFAAIGNNENTHSGVYFLDLKKCKFYQKFR